MVRDERYAYLQHGSENSLDDDVVYIFPGESLPDKQTCLEFCNYHKNENRNVLTLDPKTRVVRECLKGIPDELNNSLRRTFSLHRQIMEQNPIEDDVERVIVLKVVRAIRSILSRITRSSLRVPVKKALQAYLLSDYMAMTSHFSFGQVKEVLDIEACKAVAFQLSQTFALIHNYSEIWTKNEVSAYDPELAQFMRREPDCMNRLDLLDSYKDKVVREMKHVITERFLLNNKTPSTVNIVLTDVPILADTIHELNAITKQSVGIIIEMKPGYERCLHFGLDAATLLSFAPKSGTLQIVQPFLYNNQLMISELSYDTETGLLSRTNTYQPQSQELLVHYLQSDTVVDWFVTFALKDDKQLHLLQARNKYTNRCFTDLSNEPLKLMNDYSWQN